MTGSIQLTSGLHTAQVVDVTVGESRSSGNEMVTLRWMLEGGQTLRSYHVTKKREDGSRFEKNLAILRSVFPEWDGCDTAWFSACPNRVIGTTARIIVAYKEWNGRTIPSVERIAPPLKGEAAIPAVPMRPAAGENVQEDVELTINGVWRAFCLANPTLTKPQRDEKWFAIEDSVIIPQKDQMSYTADDWRKVLAAIRLGGANGGNNNGADNGGDNGNTEEEEF